MGQITNLSNLVWPKFSLIWSACTLAPALPLATVICTHSLTPYRIGNSRIHNFRIFDVDTLFEQKKFVWWKGCTHALPRPCAPPQHLPPWSSSFLRKQFEKILFYGFNVFSLFEQIYLFEGAYTPASPSHALCDLCLWPNHYFGETI